MKQRGKMIHRLSDIDEVNKTATCKHCGLVKIKKVKRPDGYGWRCKTQSNILDRDRKRRLRIEHGQHWYRGKNKGGSISKKGDKCERCEFTPEHTCQLDIHHKDGNHANNSEENLQTLCANCHRFITFQEKHGIYKYHYWTPPS